MQVIVNNVYLYLYEEETKLFSKVLKILGLKKENVIEYRIIKKAVDARKKDKITLVYSVLVTLDREYSFTNYNVRVANFIEDLNIPIFKMPKRPVIVGFGPAGMFLGLYLARAGVKPIILERGKSIDDRERDINNFIENGIFSSQSNVCFGEGGAGTYSDGKLSTGIKDERIRFCLKEFIKHGAPENIYYDAHPHIGSDYLKKVVKSIREDIISLGGEVRFEHKLSDIIIVEDKIKAIKVKTENDEYILDTDDLVLAIGHSARDTFRMLHEHNINMKPKPFSMGVRIEHLQEEVNKSQYGKEFSNKKLPVADYKLAIHLSNNRTLYSFCMCPGGVVVPSNSEKDSVVTNGMSFFNRDLENANSALLVNVEVSDYYHDSPLDGVEFQQKYEQKAFNKDLPYYAPVQLVKDFLNDQKTTSLGKIKPTYKPGYYFATINDYLPSFIGESLKEGIPLLAKKFPFFRDKDAVLTGVETRSSSPIAIPRNNFGMCNIIGIYPCGEGASYAGGIMSAAIDGLRIAEFIKDRYVK